MLQVLGEVDHGQGHTQDIDLDLEEGQGHEGGQGQEEDLDQGVGQGHHHHQERNPKQCMYIIGKCITGRAIWNSKVKIVACESVMSDIHML